MSLVLPIHFHRFFYILLIFWCMTGKVMAGNDGFSYGPRALGTGQISVLHTDAWSNFNNIGALGWIKQSTVAAGYENRFNQGAFSQIAFCAAIPTKKLGVAGISVSKFGGEIFNQSRAQLAWGKAFGLASIGLQAQWYQVAAVNFQTRHHLLINFGGLAQLTPKIQFGASISNVNQAKASEFQDEKIPIIVKGGISYMPSKKVKLMAEVQEDLDLETTLKVGIEYQVMEKFWLRTGFNTQTYLGSGGLGLEWRNWQFNYAICNQPQVGWSNSLGLNYQFGLAKTEAPKSK